MNRYSSLPLKNNQTLLIKIHQKKLFYFHDIINLRFKKVLKANKIQVRKLYNLRHTFASQLIADGEDTQTTLMCYTKFIEKR